MYEPMELLNKCMQDFDTEIEGPSTLGEMAIYWAPQEVKDYFKSQDELINFVTSDLFLHSDVVGYTGDASKKPLDTLNDLIKQKAPVLMEMLGVNLSDVKAGKLHLLTEFRDVLLAPLILDKWAHHKQVYAVDKDFAVALMHTEKLTLSKEMLTHLPYNIFYLDMSDLKLKDVHGAFVNVAVVGNSGYISIFLLMYDLVYFSHYTVTEFDSEGCAYFDRNDIREEKPYVMPLVKQISDEPMKDHYDFSRQDLIALIMQTLAYMSSSEPQIVESARTKNTYKPRKHGDVVKNKWSELQIFEVGYAYGAAFRKKLAKAEKEIGGAVEMLSSSQEKKRNSPRPHLRCAHWQRFRYGEGRKFLSEPRWMEPTFVGFGDLEDDMPVASVHKIC